ncbi:MAG: oligosaccharide flippase family protein [Myxococcales bacterium]|nr:oligosaccharide flippase family protein [Myxococcales bacterium]HRC55501.1 oligosaccharide flippase family protein [Kofleriaceae bacterium]
MSLAERTARGAVWTILTSMGGRVIGVLGTVIMTRFLAPDVVGEVSAATILVMTASWLTTWGFGPYVVVKGRGEHLQEIVWHGTVAYVGLGLAVLIPMAFLGGYMTPWFGAKDAAQYVPGMALVVLIKRIGAMPERVLVRDMRFRTSGMAAATGELVYTVVALSFAAGGWGGMSVIYGNLAQSLVTTGLLIRAAGIKSWATPTPLSKSRILDMLRFGAPLALEGVAHNASRYWDNLMISHYFGTAKMGTYNMAYNLADIPAVQIGEQITSVLLPSMSEMAPERRPAALERSTALLSILIFPLAVGLGLVADPLIAVVLPADRWQEVAPLLTVLATLSVFRPVTWVLSTYMETQDRTARMMFLEVGKLMLILVGIAVLSRFGLLAAAGSIGVAFGLTSLLGVVLVVRDDPANGPSPRRLAAGFLQPLLACGVMAAVVLVLRTQVLAPLGLRPLYLLIIEIAVGGVVYVAAAMVLCRDTARDLLSMLRRIARRGKREDG